MLNIYKQIEERYGFRIPDEYRALQERGLVAGPDPASELWLLEVEWMPLEEIRDYQFQDYQKPGFVPFGFTGRGDLWCWWPEGADPQGTPVVLCPHDDMMAHVEAPHLMGFLYRRVLDYVSGGFDPEDEAEAREHVRDWHRLIGSEVPAAWAETVAALSGRPLVSWQEAHFTASGFVAPEEYQQLLQRDLSFPRLDQEFPWEE